MGTALESCSDREPAGAGSAGGQQVCDDQPALEILLRNLLGDAAGLEQRLAELQARCSERSGGA